MNRNLRFRQKLQDSALMHAMSAHNPMAARLAADAGFDAIWGSGFELSASYAVPDASILSSSVHLDMMRAIAATVGVPVIADIDTGFGNAINVSYMVPQYEAAGVSAVVMEDHPRGGGRYARCVRARPARWRHTRGGRRSAVGQGHHRVAGRCGHARA